MIRDAEEKLMADVEGWEVGTFYGHKVYKVCSKNTVIGGKYGTTNKFFTDNRRPAADDEL